MSLRRPRSHRIGISNIDFRSKKDEENLRIFEPWQCSKDVGTMGYKNYRNPLKIAVNLFSPTKKINTQRDIVNGYPDPRYYTTAQFYKNNNIKIKTKSLIDIDRISNLEETFKGKDIFNGDSMNYAETVRKRKGKTIDNKTLLNKDLNLLGIEDKNNQIRTMEKLSKDKKKINKNVILETQLVKINNVHTTDNFINMKKIKEIRQTLRRRYGNRKNINKIFQQWAKTFPNKITVYDAYKMINALFIPINYNEARTFIASGSNFGNEYLNLEEFSNLIFNEDEKFQTGPFKISKEKIFYDEKEENDLKNNFIAHNKKIKDNKNIEILKDFISQRIITLNKNLKEISKEKYTFLDDEKLNNKERGKILKTDLNKCNYDKFLKGILSLEPSETFCKEEYIKLLFDEYKDKDNLIDIKNFCDNIYEKNSKEYLTKLKGDLFEISKEQVNQKKETLKKYVSANKNKKPLIYEKKFDLDKQILYKNDILEKEKEKSKEEEKQPQINSTVPSTRWIHHIYDNRNEHYNILNRAEYALSAKPHLNNNMFKGNTRFGSNPPWRNTADILIGDKNSAIYINEKERFNSDRDVGKDDKIKKEKIRLGRENRIKTAIQKYEEKNKIKEYLKDEKEMYSNFEKCNRQVNYEEIFKNKNFIIE